MKAKELRQLIATELSARIKEWRDELFRLRFKTKSSESRDTSMLKKLKRDIARALTLITEQSMNTKSLIEDKK